MTLSIFQGNAILHRAAPERVNIDKMTVTKKYPLLYLATNFMFKVFSTYADKNQYSDRKYTLYYTIEGVLVP